jgi:DNA polymerase-1
LHTTRTQRSSSSLPNFQNIPTRDDLAKAYIRKGIIPTKGNRLACIDYGSQEVRIIASVTGDPILIKHMHSLHKEEAMALFKLSEDEWTKDLRFYAKNQYVFPLFYGSWYGACSRNLWDTCKDLSTKTEVNILDHLKAKNIIKNKNDFTGFENHVKRCEESFWKRFKITKKWQEETMEFYYKNGYIEMKTGFRRSGLLSKNMIVNTPIQSVAFHCLLWSFSKLNDIAKAKGWKSKLIAQIHDEIIWDMHPDETDKVLRTTRRVMTKDIMKEFTWLKVPLEAEIELTEINESWYFKKPYLLPEE